MDNKRIFIILPIMLVLVIGYEYTLQAIKDRHPEWVVKTPDAAPTTAPATTAPTTVAQIPTTGPTTNAVTSNNISPASYIGLQPVGTDKPMPANIGSAIHADPSYPMLLSINPQGAGVESVTLNDYWDTAEHKAPYVYQVATPDHETLTRPLAMRWITINGQQLDISKINWERTAISTDSATYTARIDDNGKPLLGMTRTFQLHRRADASKGFDVTVAQSLKNTSGKPLTVHNTFNGPSTPARENLRSDDRMYITGNDAGYQEVTNGHLPPTSLYGTHSFLSGSDRWTDSKDLVAIDPKPLLWLGTCSSYFEALIVPDYAGKPVKPPVTIASAIATGIDTGIVTAPEQPTSLAINTTDMTLLPGQTAPFTFNIYFGPKWRQLLKDDPYYASFPRCFYTSLVNSSGYCGFITFGFLINALYGILWFFHKITFDWGLSIIALVILVRSLLHPITKRSQVQMLKMGKMGPEIERLKKKYGDDKDGLNKAMMGVYKEQGMAPVLGCLPMFLQTPIWIALWSALQSTFELRQAGFLRWEQVHLTWIADLSQPDNLITFNTPVPLIFFTLHQINILPLLLAVVFFINQAMQPVPAGMTPEQAQQRKMMKWMSLLFPVMLYIGPSGLNLYILTSTTIGIIESKIIRDHIKQRDAAEKAGKVIVDGGAKLGKKKQNDDKRNVSAANPGWMANLVTFIQTKVEEAQREQQRRSKDRA